VCRYDQRAGLQFVGLEEEECHQCTWPLPVHCKSIDCSKCWCHNSNTGWFLWWDIFKNPVFLFWEKSGSSSSLITTLLSESQTMFLSVISLHTHTHTHRKCYCGGGGVQMDLNFKRQTWTYTRPCLLSSITTWR